MTIKKTAKILMLALSLQLVACANTADPLNSSQVTLNEAKAVRTFYQARVIKIVPVQVEVNNEVTQTIGQTFGQLGGALVGGLLGSQIGGGSGQDLATAVGAIGGASVGSGVSTNAGKTMQMAYQYYLVSQTGKNVLVIQKDNGIQVGSNVIVSEFKDGSTSLQPL